MKIRLHPLALSMAMALPAVRPASGKPSAVSAETTERYVEGVRLEQEGNFSGALEKYKAIPVEQRDDLVRVHIASCKRKLRRYLEAMADYEAIISDPKVDPAHVETVTSDLEDMRPRIPKLTVRITSATVGASVTIDGAAVTPPITRLLNPGPHVVIAKRGDSKVFERSVTLAESSSVEVEIDAPAASSITITSVRGSGTNGASGAPASDKDRDLGSSRRTAGYVTIGIGGAFAVGALGGLLLGNKAVDDLQTYRNENCLKATVCGDDSQVSAVKRWEAITIVSAGVAVVAVGVGIGLVLTAPKAAGPALAVRAGPGTVAIEGRF